MKTVLFDFSSITSGGGVQLAMNFIDKIINNITKIGINPVLLLPQKGDLSKISGIKYFKIYRIKSSYIQRFIFEYSELALIYKTEKIDIIYTFFGPGLPHPKSIKSIVGVAYPIICYPKSSFWKYINNKLKIRQYILNKFRVYRLRKYSDLIILETEVMKDRINTYCKIDKQRLTVLPPSPTEYIEEREYQDCKTGILKIGILSGNSPHKNLWRLPEIIRGILSTGFNNFKMVISINEHMGSQIFNNKNDLFEYFEFFGTVQVNKIQKFYNYIDVMMNISDLESFSNNYMESWKTGKPIISSNRDFAKNILKKSAYYVEPHEPFISGVKLGNWFNNEMPGTNKMVIDGKKLLSELPTQKNRFDTIIRLLNAI